MCDMRHAYNLASKHSESTSAKGKKQHEKKATYSTLEAGDRVLVRNLTNGTRRSRKPADNTEFYTGTCCLPCDFLPLTPPPWRNRQANKQRKTEHYNPRPLQEEYTSGSEDGETPTYTLRERYRDATPGQNETTKMSEVEYNNPNV